MSAPDPAWQCVDPASLAAVTIEDLDRLFLELFRRTAGGDVKPSPISTLEIAEVERVVARRHGPAVAGLVRVERTPLDRPALPTSIAWDVHGIPAIELRARYQPGRDGQPASIRVPLMLRDAQIAGVFTAVWRQTFGASPQLLALRAPEGPKSKGPPFRCTNCADPLPSEPEDARTCPRCLATLEPARPIAANQWGPMRAEMHEAGLHRLFSSFERCVDTEIGVDVGFDGAIPEGAAVPPCAGIAIGSMAATRTVLLRPDGTFALARDRLVEGSAPGTFPRERVMAIDWTEHAALGRGVGERNRIRVSADHRGLRASVGEHLLLQQPPSADDADAKCVCLVAGCDAHGVTVRFDRFGRAEAHEDVPSSEDPTRVNRH